MAKKKYYAIRNGRNPGIYTSWPEAERQVKGFAGAVFKGFAEESEARLWLEKDPGPAKKSTRSSSCRKADIEVRSPSEIHIFTDGGAINNPGPGGYGIVIVSAAGKKELSSGFRHTTNNRMELLGAIVALREVAGRSEKILLFTDSSYVVKGIENGWAKGWRSRGWRKADGNPALNKDLWEELLALSERLDVTFRWVKGHAGNELNERCDRLAVGAAKGDNLAVDAVYEQENSK